MKWLAFDTSAPTVVMALFEDSKLIDQAVIAEDLKSQSKILLAEMDIIIKSCDLKLSDIEAVAVGIGPGSYTGLRMGLTVAKVWAYSKSIPLRTFRSPVERSLTHLKWDECKVVENLDQLTPVYENDHFASPTSTERK